MKRILSMIVLAVSLAALSSVTSCTPEEQQLVPLTLTSSIVETDYAEIEIAANGISQIAYCVFDKAQDNLLPTVIFASGTIVDVKTTSVIRIENLDANKRYYVYAAAKVSDVEFLDEVLSINFRTKAYDFDQLITLVEPYYQGYKLHLTMPESVRNNTMNAIRFNYSSIPMYLTLRNRGTLDMEMLLTNGGKHVRTDTTIVNTPENEYLLDKDGNVVYDEYDQAVMIHEPIAPGEPYVFLAGEFTMGESMYGWGQGYYAPLFDLNGFLEGVPGTGSNVVNNGFHDLSDPDQDPYWTGNMQKLTFKTLEPQPLDAEFDIDVVTSPVEATISIVPSDNVALYCYTILDQGTYDEVLNSCLDKNEDWLQWFVSSYFAMFNLGISYETGPIRINAGNFFAANHLEAMADYHILITALGDEQGSTQKFIHEKFTTDPKVLPAPEVVVTAVEDKEHEYEVKFNIRKAEGSSDITAAQFACNYVREWQLSLNGGATYDELVASSYASFTADEIELINSPEGYTVSFPSVDDQTSRMAVLVQNAEYTSNRIENARSSAVADCSTKAQVLKPRVNSDLFTELEGEWTATATLHFREYDDNNELIEYDQKVTTVIDIINDFTYPSSLTQDIYDLYEEEGQWTTERVDAFFEDYKETADLFERNRMTYQNRLLCIGWFPYDIYPESRLEKASPWDLFTHRDYSCIDCSQIFFDFGPKWWLEIAEDGTVTAPFDADKFLPMTNWRGDAFHFGVYDRVSNHGTIVPSEGQTSSVPVEVSADRKTITLKAIEREGVKYYPNAISTSSIAMPVVSEVVMKKNDKKSAKVAPSFKADAVVPYGINHVDAAGNSVKFPEVVARRSMTGLVEPVKFKYVENPSVITKESLEEGLRKYAEKYNIK